MDGIRKNSAVLVISALIAVWIFGISLMGMMGHSHDSVCPLSGMSAMLCPMTLFSHIQQVVGLFAVPVISFAWALVAVAALIPSVSVGERGGRHASQYYNRTRTERCTIIPSLQLAFADGTIQPRFFA